MLRRIPTPASSTTRLEPPYERNGSGIPVNGAAPMTARMFTAACPQTSTVSPAPDGDVEAGVGEQRVGDDHRGDADEPELLADVGEHHVRVRFRQIEDLLHAAAEPDADDVT